MATSGSVLCGVCDGKQGTRCADYYCPECEEGLCSECQQHHKLSRASKNHPVVLVEHYKKLPDFMKKVSEYCTEHEKKVTNYCPHHDQVCCPRCLTSIHHECTNIKVIDDLTENAKKSSLVLICEQKLEDMSIFLNKAIEEKKQNLFSLRNQKSRFREEIKSIRSTINTHLEKLEEDIMEALEKAESQTKTQIEAFIKQLAENAKKVDDYAHGLKSLLEFGSDHHAFFGTRLIQDEIGTEEKFLKSISEDGSLKNVLLDLKVDGKIKDMLSAITKFGSVAVKLQPSSLVYNGEKDIQTNITPALQQTPTRSINDIELTLLSTIDIPASESKIDIRGCCVSPDGKIMCTDNKNSRLIIFKESGRVHNQCPITRPTDVSFIDNNNVAVSTFDGIMIIDIITTTTKHEINSTGNNIVYGVTYYKGSLLWCETSKGIQSKQLPDGDICTLVQQEGMLGNCYITTYNDRIYQTNNQNKTVTCFTLRGKKEWEFTDDVLLASPVGITVDNDRNVYATSGNSVVVISSEGTHGRQLLSENDGLQRPYGIYYDKSKNNLLIVNRSGPAFLYHMS